MAFDIILFAVIVAVLYLRLRSVLGTRTGFEKTIVPDQVLKELKDAIETQAKIIQPETGFESYPVAIKDALVAIRLSSRQGFDDKSFLKGAELAFEAIVKAYSREDFIALQKLLGDDVYQAFAKAAGERQTKGENLDTTIVSVQSKEITDARFHKPNAEITVKFISEQINVTKNKEGVVVGGSETATELVTDVWTFGRDVTSKNPNWKLVKTTVEA